MLKRIKTLVFFIFPAYLLSDSEYIIYSEIEMKAHKTNWQNYIESLQKNCTDTSYQTLRAIFTLFGDDADYIPKIAGAGELFYDNDFGWYQLMHNGIKVIANGYYNSQWITDVIYGLKGHHEPQEEKCFYEILKHIPNNAIMIELGSYWGYYSLWFAQSVKNGQTYLIEPDPQNLELGKRNFALNQQTGHFIRGYAGILEEKTDATLDAPHISIDDFLNSQQLNHVHIIHADIQGGEYQMLLSCIKHLNAIDYFVISTHNPETAHFPCLRFFEDNNFIILAEHSDWESCSGDGLIVAKRVGVRGPEEIPIKKYRRPY